jgi:PDZ domain
MRFVVASMLVILASRWCPRTSGFTVLQDRRPSRKSMALDTMRVNLDTISDVGYEATVEKPLGVVFGENRPPFNGLCIDSVVEGSNGEQAGLKVGDQLLAVNGQSVIGEDFDTAMDALRSAESPVELRLYKGLVSTLFSIVMNRRSDDDDDFEEETSEEVIFDESYESPVVMTFDDDNEDDKISVSAVAGEAVKNLGQMFGKSFSSMFSQETIQLEEKDGK